MSLFEPIRLARKIIDLDVSFVCAPGVQLLPDHCSQTTKSDTARMRDTSEADLELISDLHPIPE